MAAPFCELKPKKALSVLAAGANVSLHDNLILHGDNLLALKALLPTHAGRINCVYIDPPYNTGNEGWCYNDNVANPMIKEWLGKEVDREDLTRHDKWLCMMYPRLCLLHELLAEDGVIFISIDDNEVHRLRLLMDEIFGEDEFVACITWRKKAGGGQDSEYFAREHDYVLCYRKSESFAMRFRKIKISEKDFPKTKNGRKCKYSPLEKWGAGSLRTDRPTLFYAIKDPDGNDFYPQAPNGEEGRWRIRPPTLDNEHIHWEWDKKKNRWRPFEVSYFDEAEKEKIVKDRTVFYDLATTTDATFEMQEIFGSKVFDNSKPVDMIRRLLIVATGKNSIILDSCAGSGTTAHAVMALNKEDGGDRKFVLVECEKYANEITAERVRRIIKGVPNAKDENLRAGFGGGFSYWEVGDPIQMDSILDRGALPSYEELARYVFYTATGEEWNPKKMRKGLNYIGDSRLYEVYLLYKPDINYLKKTALTLDFAENLPPPSRKGKIRVVFAPVRYVDYDVLQDLGIKYCQLPFQIYKMAEQK